MWQYVDYNELYHHGIQGQQWGVRNGPPYPLNTSSHSAKEKRVSGYDSASSGKEESNNGIGSKSSKNALPRLDKPESWDETLKNCNPTGDMYNCVLCSITSDLRQKGYDVQAGTTHRNSDYTPLTLRRVYPDLGDDGTMYYGQVPEFVESYESACKFLKDSFGDNASGICGISWDPTICYGGHAFSWVIKDGSVEFYDCQSGDKGEAVKQYWEDMFDGPYTTVARLDNRTVNEKAVKKFVM